MPRSSTRTPSSSSDPNEPVEERIIDIDVGEEMRNAFLEYSYSVIYSRALPDARDGLKPVQRRILFGMSELGLRPDRAHVKSQRVIGEVMGKYHPHGDQAIYDALVRMAQPFTMRLPLIDGHGNFGSLDDGPAAARYTEARMAASALLMVGGLGEDTVDFIPNYDDTETQPEVLPAAFPNLLVNGASGIAVGMATNMAPHNLVEVIGAARHLIANPTCSLDDLMKFVPGPDLPGGGRIIGLDGIRDAYLTGRGAFRTRATARVDSVNPRRKGIVVTELPYLIGPEKVIEKIKDLVQSKRLLGIADVKDLTDRAHGMQLVIEVKNGFNPDAVLEQLYRLTPMEESFNINNVALVEGQPRTLGLKDLLKVYVDFRTDVVRRRTAYRLARREERLHLVEGLLVAILDIDEVIQLIRGSDDAATARQRLIEVFDLSEVQATYILDLQLRRLTKFSRLELENEKAELERQIEELRTILGDEKLLLRTVSAELAEVAKAHGTPRRTVLLESAGTPVTTSTRAAPCRSRSRTTRAGCCSRRPACSRAPSPTSRCPATAAGAGTTSSSARCGRPRAARSVSSPVAAGWCGSRPWSCRPCPTPPAPRRWAVEPRSPPTSTCRAARSRSPSPRSPPTLPAWHWGPPKGVVKRVTTDYPGRPDFELIGLRDGDSVVGAAEVTDEGQDLVFITSDAQLLHFPASQVRPQGRPAGGMAGVKLAPGQRAVWFGVVDPAQNPVVVTSSGSSGALPGTEPGALKVTPYAEYPAKGRATGGVRCHRFLKGEDTLVLAWAGGTPARAAAANGVAVELPPATGRRDGSGTPAGTVIARIAGPPSTTS